MHASFTTDPASHWTRQKPAEAQAVPCFIKVLICAYAFLCFALPCFCAGVPFMEMQQRLYLTQIMTDARWECSLLKCRLDVWGAEWVCGQMVDILMEYEAAATRELMESYIKPLCEDGALTFNVLFMPSYCESDAEEAGLMGNSCSQQMRHSFSVGQKDFPVYHIRNASIVTLVCLSLAWLFSIYLVRYLLVEFGVINRCLGCYPAKIGAKWPRNIAKVSSVLVPLNLLLGSLLYVFIMRTLNQEGGFIKFTHIGKLLQTSSNAVAFGHVFLVCWSLIYTYLGRGLFLIFKRRCRLQSGEEADEVGGDWLMPDAADQTLAQRAMVLERAKRENKVPFANRPPRQEQLSNRELLELTAARNAKQRAQNSRNQPRGPQHSEVAMVSSENWRVQPSQHIPGRPHAHSWQDAGKKVLAMNSFQLVPAPASFQGQPKAAPPSWGMPAAASFQGQPMASWQAAPLASQQGESEDAVVRTPSWGIHQPEWDGMARSWQTTGNKGKGRDRFQTAPTPASFQGQPQAPPASWGLHH